jgi:hypothetical protein
MFQIGMVTKLQNMGHSLLGECPVSARMLKVDQQSQGFVVGRKYESNWA